jgi:membrane protease YdiL (CAAX protease family)
VKDKEIIIKYLVGTFLITYFMWGIILVASHFGYLKVNSFGFWIIYTIGGLSSMFFGAYLARKSGKVNNYLSIIKETFDIRQKIKYYGLVFIFIAISFDIPFLFGASENKISWYFLVLLIVRMIFFGGLEEIGWRYTFQPALERHIPFSLASIITGILWAFWHLPLFFMDGMNKLKKMNQINISNV